MNLPPVSMLLQPFNAGNIAIIIAVFLLIGCSSFCSFCETTFSAANVMRIKTLAEEKQRGARKALWIIEQSDKTLSTILVGNTFVNTGSATLAAYVLSVLISNPTISNLVSTLGLTVLVLLFGEILPKTAAKANPEKYALKLSGTLFALIKIFTPFTWLILKLQKGIRKNVQNNSPTITENELESIIDTMEEEGVLSSEEAHLFQGVIDLNEKTAYDIMTPRIDMISLNVNAKETEIKEQFVKWEFSRIPVYEEDKDHIIGILAQKDYFKAVLKGEKIDLRKMITQPIFVAENIKVKEVIREMQSKKKHMAIVVDEHGGTSGIVTLEDALEEVVGEIYDEQDDYVDPHTIKKIDDKTYDLSPEAELSDLFDELEIENLPDTEYTTVGGLLYELSENLPSLNQKLSIAAVDEFMDESGKMQTKTVKLNFQITKLADKRIKRVMLTLEDNEQSV